MPRWPALALARPVMFSCAVLVLGTATTATGGGMGKRENKRERCLREGNPSEQLVMFLHIHKAGGSSVVASALAGLCGPKAGKNGLTWRAPFAATNFLYVTQNQHD